MLSIIIVNYKTWTHISNGLKTLLPSLPENADVEIIVVDNHSDDGKLKGFAAQHPEITTIQSQGNFGYAHGCNAGAKIAKGDWLLFMNPDVVADWENLKNLWNAAKEHPDYAILTAPQFSLKGKLQKAFGPFLSARTASPLRRAIDRKLHPERHPDPRTPIDQLEGIVDVDWVSGSLLMISKLDFDAIYGWDEDYWLYHEDVDICQRVHKRGRKVGYFSGSHFTHVHAASTRSSLATTALAKSETILSKNVYLLKHMPNAEGESLRAKYRNQTNRIHPILRLLNSLCLGKAKKIDLLLRIHTRLKDYYRRVDQTGNSLSERSINYPKHQKLTPSPSQS